MKIIKQRIKLELSPTERNTFEEMVAFTHRFFKANNECVNFSCTACPLNMFCGGPDLSRTAQNAIEEIEDFLNGEE